MKIEQVDIRLYRVPLPEPLEDSVHGIHTHFELVICDIHAGEGMVGVGYTYTGGFGGAAICQMLKTDLVPFLIGKDPDGIFHLWNALNWRVHYVGKGGLASFAIAALDIALWDIRGKKCGLPLWKLAGGTGRTARAYGGGIDLNYPVDRLLENVKGYLDTGLRAVKIKVGKERLDEDLERVAAVRKFIGKDIEF
ncbi:MAG: uroporphyrinogen decarboxylase, partial [Planctomycetes bacterium]|nr:uroporphyrinogen decarboxylase [Planctomycetota bacterium]